MLEDSDLEVALREIESDRVERKASFSDRDRVCEAICAMANDLADRRKPGVIFIGANDDGTCAGLQVTDKLLLDLAAIRGDGNILPFPVMSVYKRTLAGGEMVVIEVRPSLSPPVRYKGRVYIRVGPRRAIATPEEERRLTEKRLAADPPFDQRPIKGVTLDDLDVLLFERVYLPSAIAPDVLAANQRATEQQLASLRFLSSERVPNAAAILTFGKNPLAWISGAYVQFARFEGLELTDPIRHQKELSGPLPELLRQLDEVLDANISVATDVQSGATEVRRPDYPIVALQQLTRNAVLHRSYEATNAPVRVYWFTDRIEIHSPGGLFGQVTPENFGQPGVTDYRNPLLAEAMKVLGYVQRFGMGLQLAREALDNNGNPTFEHELSPNAVLAKVRKQR
ncbi:MAG: putative DNA binding domain-containing protein [Pirellulales bacterium]|nr:putative DNA binding domain-containing protein [Pirellulales bacterium]